MNLGGSPRQASSGFFLLAFLPRLPSVVDLDLEIKLNNFFRLLIALGHGICHNNRVMTRRK